MKVICILELHIGLEYILRMLSQCLDIQQNVRALDICKVGALVGPYKMQKLLGSGAFGQVFQAVHITKNIKIAIKIVDIDSFKVQTHQELKKRLARDEVIHMQRCDCQHVIKFKGKFSNSHLIGILMELCEGGNLMEFILKREQQSGISEQEALQIIQQILYGINQLHSKNILHRDIKPQNILIHNGYYVISDLGFSKYQCISLKGTNLGTIQMKAPQIIFGGEYSKQIDMWAIGVTFFRMLYGLYPFPNKIEQLKKVIKLPIQYPQSRSKNRNQGSTVPVSMQIRKLIASFLQIDPNKRITVQNALNNPIFQRKYSSLSQSYIPQQKSEVQEPPSQIINSSSNLQSNNTLQQLQYLQARQQHFLGLKSEFIHNIIKRIEQADLLEVNTRKEKQLLLLLATRCWIYMSNFNYYYTVKKGKQNYTQLARLAEKFQIRGLYNQVKFTFEKYSKLLQEAESSAIEVLKDFFKGIFFQKQENQKKVFIDGIQKIDYVLEQQLNFTNLYIQDIIEESFKAKKYFMKDQIVKILKCYKQINLIDCQQTYNKNSTFKTEVQKIVGLETSNLIFGIIL